MLLIPPNPKPADDQDAESSEQGRVAEIQARRALDLAAMQNLTARDIQSWTAQCFSELFRATDRSAASDSLN